MTASLTLTLLNECILFSAFRYPFNDSEHATLFAKISRGHFLVPECLSSKARCIIRALLRRDPDERITSDDVLHHPWLKLDDTKEYACKSNAQMADDQCVPEWTATMSSSSSSLASGSDDSD
jgi:serine/threonine protein kinase